MAFKTKPAGRGGHWAKAIRGLSATGQLARLAVLAPLGVVQATHLVGATMSNAPTPGPSRCVFGWALLCGLGWGIGAATAIAAAAAMLLPSNGPLGAALELATWTALIASFLAIFPIAPIAGVAGWLLYRSGVLTPVAYAAIGAFSAVIAPVLVAFLLEETMRYQSTVNYAVLSETGVQLILFGTAVAGAFGGFMGGRALQSARDFE